MGNIKHSSDYEIPHSSLLFIPEGNANSSPEGSNKSVAVMGCLGRSVSTSTNLLDPIVSSTPDLVSNPYEFPQFSIAQNKGKAQAYQAALNMAVKL
ncbi:CCR4 NOT transcription complex subunit 2 [Echinococcus multilocularis]|uniref:CCR4 NOT transcription complex subunit 2 n=1 Tax=Echinococcus multilocularis TaxID=6211 RepID=A0A0S4MLT9_ECHMU|nr:CCR4 NOT transcription complex subunit 2 [Echinococcus multilocularis]CUT99708.1 CCR4 NOT transcription complex subunit 2 [Echinococcus multilocularis]